MANFIKIDRKILKWEWWSDINTCRLFIYMLIAAYWKSEKYKGRDIPRGSFPSSISELSKETNLTENEIRTALKHLKSTGEITSKTHGKFSVFTIKNYDAYQSDNTQDYIQITRNNANKSHSINTLLTSTILKENKNDKNENNNIQAKEAEELFEKLWKLYPVKKGKGSVSDVKKVKLLKIGFDEMSRAIERYIRYVDSVDYLRYKDGSTFFNSGYVDYLDENYVPEKNSILDKKNKFNRFPQRDYDMNDLEKKLLERN